RELNLEPVHLFTPSFLALIASIFDGAMLALLAPTMQGLMQGDFAFASKVKGIGTVIRAFPQFFAHNSTAIFIFLVLLIFSSAIIKNIFSYISSVLIAKQV